MIDSYGKIENTSDLVTYPVMTVYAVGRAVADGIARGMKPKHPEPNRHERRRIAALNRKQESRTSTKEDTNETR